MAKRSKAYKAAEAKIEEGKLYTPAEAVALAKETSSAKLMQPLRWLCASRLTPVKPIRWFAAP